MRRNLVFVLGSMSLIVAACQGGNMDSDADGDQSTDNAVTANLAAGNYVIKTAVSGKCLDVSNGSLADGAQLWEFVCNGTPAQEFEVAALGDGFYKIVNVRSHKSLDIRGASTVLKAPLQQWSYVGATNQQFKIVDRGNGQVSIHPRHTDMALEVSRGSTEDKTPIVQYTYSGRTKQLWTFTRVDGSTTNPDDGTCEPEAPRATHDLHSNPDGADGPVRLYWDNTDATGYVTYTTDLRLERLEDNGVSPWYYFANQSTFSNVGFPVGWYMGMQTNWDGGGGTFVFSVFGDGIGVTVPEAGNCNGDADGGPGVACLVHHKVEIGTTYRLKATRTAVNGDNSTWTGTATDLKTCETFQIGKWTVPTAWGLIGSSGNQAWIEWFAGGGMTCSERPSVLNFFGNPVGLDEAGKSWTTSLNANLIGGTCAVLGEVNEGVYIAESG